MARWQRCEIGSFELTLAKPQKLASQGLNNRVAAKSNHASNNKIISTPVKNAQELVLEKQAAALPITVKFTCYTVQAANQNKQQQATFKTSKSTQKSRISKTTRQTSCRFQYVNEEGFNVLVRGLYTLAAVRKIAENNRERLAKLYWQNLDLPILGPFTKAEQQLLAKQVEQAFFLYLAANPLLQTAPYHFKKITYRYHQTRWGVCYADRRLNFNPALALLPEHLQNYIFCHELCHLCELNHSQQFWQILSKHLPDYRDCIKSLRGYKLGKRQAKN